MDTRRKSAFRNIGALESRLLRGFFPKTPRDIAHNGNVGTVARDLR